ncbi:carboxymuconolactone decarboxylase family protein [Corynebacterium glyciniphilum]|uniref:carboxymuconolactone decarboxylase family protein n=1 Tax=Corynebacterium glyciniphilum TaxID=1404244 RepID=UPI003DA072DB
MKYLTRTATLGTAVVTSLALAAAGCSSSPEPEDRSSVTERTNDLDAVSPALAEYDTEQVEGLWEDDSLSARDRGLVTIATLISADSTNDLGYYVDRALDDGLAPEELSEAVTHLAFYAGWPTAMAAVPVIANIYEDRGIDADQLPDTGPELLPQDEEAEAERAADVQQQHGPVSQGVVDSTGDVVFNDLWLRPGLDPRDRSLVTVVALIATSQPDQVEYHLGRAMDNGLTADEVDAVLDHIIFFTGWPRVFTALPVARDVLDSRS